MKLFNKTEWTKPFPEKLEKRVSRIPTAELEMWIDQSIYEVGRCLSGYTKSRDIFYLEEARVGAEALHAVVEELYKRSVK
jgi:transcription elongation factor